MRRQRGDVPVAEPPHQAYARASKMLGNGRLVARLADGRDVRCRVRGKMRRREWVNPGDLVLLAFREGVAGDTADVLARYLPAEVATLKRLGEPVTFSTSEEEALQEDYVTFESLDAAPDETTTTTKPRPRDMPPTDSDDDDDWVAGI